MPDLNKHFPWFLVVDYNNSVPVLIAKKDFQIKKII
jgi:hypothetical protein